MSSINKKGRFHRLVYTLRHEKAQKRILVGKMLGGGGGKKEKVDRGLYL